jgi:glycosyltransferase involved in cell wall biosynthesis
MATRPDEDAFTKGDPVSKVLIDLAADRAPWLEKRIPAGVIELAQRHGLTPILADHTEDHVVRAIAAREAARRGILQKHLMALLSRLDDAQIRTAVLKGPTIAATYADPSHRSYSDLDLLVPEHHVEQALELIANYPATASVPKKRPKADKRDIIVQDENGVRFNVDVHWDLFSYSQLRGSAEGATETAWTEAVLQPDNPMGPQWDLPMPYRIVFLCAHAVLDHRFRLILFRDFLEIARDEVDWESVGDTAQRWGLRSTTYLALWMARSAVGADVPPGFLRRLPPRSLPITYLEWALPRTDTVRFDGHRPHPINLASVLLNDSRWGRFSLLLRAPAAFPRWWRRVTEEESSLRPPRILILVSTDRRRGAEVFTERLRDGLLRLGWVTEAVALKSSGEEPRADLEALVSHEAPSGGRFDPRIATRLREKVRSFRPDVVLANGGATLRYAVAGNIPSHYKLVYVGIGEPHYWLRSRFSRWLNRWMLRQVDQVLAVSEVTGEQLEELEPAVRGRVVTTHTGVPDSLFDIPMEPPAGPLRILMIGSLTPEKNPAQAMRVMSQLPSARLRFLGDGPLREELERDAMSLAVEDRVAFLGSVIDVTPHLKWAHVLILTSLSEGLPGAILEAGAAGVATVAVEVGGVREAVEDGVGGLVTGKEDEDLVEALVILDADRERLAQMGKAAREHVMSHFRMDDVIQRYADALIDVTR